MVTERTTMDENLPDLNIVDIADTTTISRVVEIKTTLRVIKVVYPSKKKKVALVTVVNDDVLNDTDENTSKSSPVVRYPLELRLGGGYDDGKQDGTLGNDRWKVREILRRVAIMNVRLTRVVGFLETISSGSEGAAEGTTTTTQRLNCMAVDVCKEEVESNQEPAAIDSNRHPTLLFDLNYCHRMNDIEVKSLARQLTLCYGYVRSQSSPFRFVFAAHANSGPASSTMDPWVRLRDALVDQGWDSWVGVEKWVPSGSSLSSPSSNQRDSWIDTEPWDVFLKDDGYNVIYLTADSPNILGETQKSQHNSEGQPRNNTQVPVYIVGGLVDHTYKPHASLDRATQQHKPLPTARLPLEQYCTVMHRDPSRRVAAAKKRRTNSNPKTAVNTDRDAELSSGVDLTTLAVVQMLVLHHDYSTPSAATNTNNGTNVTNIHVNDCWGRAISTTPAMHCAPLKKYVRWKHPYQHYNDKNLKRPVTLFHNVEEPD
mmetsp:Transcript_22414/g.27394  ORF Transcript_22414/g.27394 Transcript_22414/m.27394 type:complete len:485 (-) Transcript_22414:41-1495(-)